MEPTGSGQKEIERESPVLFEDSNKSCPTGEVHSDMLYWGDTYLMLKKRGGWDGKTHVISFARNLFKNNIYQRYKKRPATLHTLPFNSFMSPVHPESRLLEDIHEKERESDAMLFKAITTSRHPSCRTFSYLPA